jgi:primosomal protein N' (replication factor Y)
MQKGELDILIGTQLVATRHPRPVAALVGLIYPDAALHLPDFRAAERAYHTLREVTSLTKEPDSGIVLQTCVPQHHVMRSLAQRDPSIFYMTELADREALGYPPFGRLIGLQVSGTKEESVAAAAIRWAALIRQGKAATTGKSIELLGPIPASPPQLRKRFRWRLLVKGRDGHSLRRAVQVTLTEIESSSRAGGLRYDIDVDPQSLI